MPSISPHIYHLKFLKGNQSALYLNIIEAQVLRKPGKGFAPVKEDVRRIPPVVPILERDRILIEQGHDVEGAAGAEQLVKTFELDAW